MDTLHFEAEFAPAHTLSLHELLEVFLKHNTVRDRSDLNNIKKAFELLAQCHPAADTANFGAKSLRLFQDFLIAKDYTRNYINKLVKFFKYVVKWAVSYELVSTKLYIGLKSVPEVQHGRARENKKRQAASHESIDAVSEHVPQMIADMLAVMRQTGMRTCEVCRITPASISTAIDRVNWIYKPLKHKSAWRGKEKTVGIGIQVQEILKPYIEATENPNDPIFKNRDGKAFTTATFGRCIKKSIDRNSLEKFTAHQVRHRTASDISEEYGRDFARAFLGHTSEITTSTYDHSDLQKVLSVVNDRNPHFGSSSVPTLKIYAGE